MLAVTDLNVRYGMHEALGSISLEVSRDEVVVILGANGAGKSTLLSAIAGNCEGDVNGRILLDGENIMGLDAAQVVEHGIAFVPEGRGVFADLSVEENLQLGSYTEHARNLERQNLREVLSLFPKLEERKKQIVRTMSGGEQQMVAIGRALMSAPTILMLDEPSLGLSPLLCKELFSSLKKVRESGVGILLVEQNAKQSLSISDRGYLLGNGKILGQDSAENLLNDPSVQAAYLGGAIASRNKTPVVHTIKTPDERVETPEAVVAELSITPNNAGRSAPSVSSDSLLDEDLDALVARAGYSAAQYREVDASLPMQVVKLSNNRAASVGSSSAQIRTETTSGSSAVNSLELPETKDDKVQALLADMEAAARQAAGISGREKGDGQRQSLSSSRVEHYDDPDLLPHIPVYKKSPVTVYRRNGGGKLRKQD